MVEISNKNNNKVVRVSVGGNSGNNPSIKPNGDYSSYYSELSKAWAIKMDGMVSKEDYSSKYYSTQAKANAETTENNLNSVISEHEQITNEITEARENISGDLSGALTDIATARDNGVAKVTETKTNSLSEIESAKSEAEQTITTGLNNFNANAKTKSDSLQSQFDSAMTDITLNKEQSMSAIDENRTTSIEEILANKTSSMNAIDKNRTDTLSEINTMRSEAISNVEAVKTSAEKTINDTKISAENSITDIKNTAISDVQNQEKTTEENIDKKVQEALNKIPDIDDKLNVSKMYKTGEISTDITGYKQLVEMKHSTFDKSKFTVVGSPTITDDGVASGFSVNNYIKTPNVSELSKITESFKFTSSFVYNTLSSEQTIWNKNLNFDLRLINSSIILRTYDGSKSNNFSILQSQHKVANGEQVFCDVVITPNLCRIKINGVEYTKKQVTDFSFLINTAYKSFLIGMSNAFNFYFHTSIDLKSISITVDGKEVFNGNKTGTDTVKIGGETVEIPYTLSKTGSKIVDVAYRDKIQALYEQEGSADYYTIDEENQNFTLPMGEIYGMINSIKPINNYQVNNTNSYGDNKYVGDTILNNLSWLRSTGQENSGTISIGFYNWAVANIGQPFGAGYIKENSATYITDYDLVINKSKQTFILPTLNGEESVISSKYTNLTLPKSETISVAPANGYISFVANMNANSACTLVNKTSGELAIRTNTGNSFFSAFLPVRKDDNYFIQYDGLNSVIRYRFVYAKGNGNLYYYVGDTLQNADLINIARMQEQITDINAQSRGYLVESYTDGTSGYRLYSDGFCEQRGYSNVDSNTLRTITFLKPYKDTNYVVTLGSSNINDNNQNSRIAKVASITTKNMVVTGIFNNALGADFHFYWRTCGYVK